MKESAYRKAGVDIDAGDALVERIKAPVKKTLRPGVMAGLGGFGALFDLKATGYKDPVLVSSTDGVGTKLKVAIESGIHDTVGIDLVAMCVNDLVVMGAEPLFFLDYFASGKLNVDQAEAVITGIAHGCVQAGCALIGGETAEMPGMYAKGDYDLAGFTVGAVERGNLITGDRVEAGDVVLGLASSGVHSNGFSLVRRIVEQCGLSFNDKAPFAPDKTLGEALLVPTKIYVRPLLQAMQPEQGAVHALAHITGGGLLENIPRVVPDHLCVRLDAKSWPLLPVFTWMKDAAKLSADDLARTFNCGIGMIAVCAPDRAAVIAAALKTAGESVYTIGHIANDGPGGTVIIENGQSVWQTAS